MGSWPEQRAGGRDEGQKPVRITPDALGLLLLPWGQTASWVRPLVALQTQGQLRRAGPLVGDQVGSLLCRDLPPRRARRWGEQWGGVGGADLCPQCGRPPLAQLWPARGPGGGRMGTVPVTADRCTSMRHRDSLQRRREGRRELGTRHACSVNPEMTRHVQPQPRPLRAGSEALEARRSAP